MNITPDVALLIVRVIDLFKDNRNYVEIKAKVESKVKTGASYAEVFEFLDQITDEYRNKLKDLNQ